MTDALLALNAGSSSLKFALYPTEGDVPIAAGLVDRIGAESTLRLKGGDGAHLPVAVALDMSDHAASLRTVLAALVAAFPGLEILAVGHRVAHGGPDHDGPALIDDRLIAELEALSPFAPLHQPHNIAGIRAAIAAFPEAPQVACFDTAFHRAHPFVNDTFALPRAYYDKGVRRYGFHGLSYAFVTGELVRVAPRLAEGRVVIAHLGNGASICAIHNGRSVASTMGFSALDGLPMGTRCGQLDPGVVLFLMQQEGLDADAIVDLLYKRSGLLGLSGLSNDMRVLEAAGTTEANQAIDYFVVCVQREVGAMAAAMGGIDALLFCGGIGENSWLVRARVCERLAWMGIEIDHERNALNAQVISSPVARTPVLVVTTNEELLIVREVRSVALGSDSVTGAALSYEPAMDGAIAAGAGAAG